MDNQGNSNDAIRSTPAPALTEATLTRSLFEQLAPALGVDWIEVSAFEPHWSPDVKVRNERHPTQEFFCPQITWSLNGKLSRVRVPLKLKKHENHVPLGGNMTWHTLDYRAMEDWAIRTIQSALHSPKETTDANA